MQPETPPEAPNQPVQTTPVPTASDKLYQTAKSLLGQHLTLDSNVPPELGCAECASVIANKAGVQRIPSDGFASTNQFHDFMMSTAAFAERLQPAPGFIVVAVTEGSKHGHIGYFAAFGLQYQSDWGILSNDSNTGRLSEQWSWSEWQKYYTQELGLETHIFEWLG